MNCTCNKTTSDSVKNISTALLEVQRGIYGGDRLLKDSENSHFHNKYVQLKDLLSYVVPKLNKNGILLTQGQAPSRKEGEAYVVTRLTHAETGEWIESHTTAPPMQQTSYDKSTKDRIVSITPQSYCASITYCCRYGLQSLMGIPTYDDDGETASGRPDTKIKESPYITRSQAADLKALAEENGIDEKSRKSIVKEMGNASSWNTIRKDNYEDVLKAIDTGLKFTK